MTSLPPEATLRRVLHDEVHARPVGLVACPAVVFCLAVLNHGVTRADELTHLNKLLTLEGINQGHLSHQGSQDHQHQQGAGQFLSFKLSWCELKWERHTEFSRYTVVMPLSSDRQDCAPEDLRCQAQAYKDRLGQWLGAVPGQTIAAIEVTVLPEESLSPEVALALADVWYPNRVTMASYLGNHSHSLVMTDFLVNDDGIERVLLLTAKQTSPARAGRTVQRLMEVEIYRLVALLGLPLAKQLSSELSAAEHQLAVTAREVERGLQAAQDLLNNLAHLSAHVERIHADHSFRFSATHAYHEIMRQRIHELRETPLPGVQTIGEFMLRRVAPAMATVSATAKRLDSLSERVSRVSDLLRTRVDIVTEKQNQQLLEKLTRGQDLQLKLQQTVEGLSIAAISYYVVSLVHYLAKAGKSAGWLSISPDLVAGISIAPTVAAVWWVIGRVHRAIRQN